MSKIDTTKFLRLELTTTTDVARVEVKTSAIYISPMKDHLDEANYVIHVIGGTKYYENAWAMNAEALVQNMGRRYLSRDAENLTNWNATATASGIGHQDTAIAMVRAALLMEAAKAAEKIAASLQGKYSTMRYYVDSADVRGLHIYVVVDAETGNAVAHFSEEDAENNSPYNQAQAKAYVLNGGPATYEPTTVVLNAEKVLGKALAARTITEDPAEAIGS